MNKKINNGLAIIMPNKKINLFVIFMLVLGIISGCIFLMTIKDTDKDIIINQITNFIKNINDNQINNSSAFLNSLYENYIYPIFDTCCKKMLLKYCKYLFFY